MVVSISFFGKMLGCVSAARYNGMTWREAFSIGFLMNCKGLVEYIILNIGHDAGVISDRVFVILITMCVILTMMSTPFVGYLYPVSYQKEMEVRREAERKLQLNRTSSFKSGMDTGKASAKKGFFAGLTSRLRNRKGGHKKDLEEKYNEDTVNTNYENLEGIRIDSGPGKDESGFEDHSWKSRNAIMFCLDKTPNAPGVMTMLQLFSGTMGICRSKPYVASTENNEDGTGQSDPGYKGVLQPSIDISDPQGNRRTQHQKSETLEYEVDFSKIYAIRLLHISERTSAALLTASRCMDRLYKDTVMMMVMAFAKLNSIPLKPLVSLSTDGQSTAAQDILDRAVDLNVGWIVYPWNSSHLVDLPTTVGPTLLSGNNNTTASNLNDTIAGAVAGGGSTHLQPGLMMSIANTGVTTNSALSVPATPDATSDTSRQLPYNISRYFDHDEAQKIASGGHVDLSHASESHRTSISSNTKVLSKLIPASADARISTAVLVDRGLGLFGGVEHLVVPLLGGEDDYETLCLASCLARSTNCFVTILRISSVAPITVTSSSGLHPNISHSIADRSVPPTPDGISSTIRQRQSFRRTLEEGSVFDPLRHRSDQCPPVPVDDKTLFKMFFPNKPPFKGRPSCHQRALDAPNLLSSEEGGEDGTLEDGVMVLNFQELGDAVQWARSCLTAQDLMVIGFDSNFTAGTVHRSAGYGTGNSNNRPLSTVSDSRIFTKEDDEKTAGAHTGSNISGHSGNSGESRSPLIAGGDVSSTLSSPRSILERRGLHLSPPSPLKNSNNGHPPLTSTSSAPPTPSSVGFDEDSRRGRGSYKAGAASGKSQRSKSRGARSSRSISKGRKGNARSAGGADQDNHRRHLSASSSVHPISTGVMTTCQVMLGFAADQMIQSGVNSSLLVVRSRWFADRVRSHQHSIGLSLGQFKLGVSLTSASMNATHQQHDVRQYHSQQQQHHAREHSRLSQDWTNIQLGSHVKTRAVNVPDVTVEDASEREVVDAGHSRDASQKRELDEDDLVTPRTSQDVN